VTASFRRARRIRRRPSFFRGVLWLQAVALAIVLTWFFLQSPPRRREMAHLVESAWIPGSRVSVQEVLSDIWELYVALDAPMETETSEDRRWYVGGIPQPTAFPFGSIRVLRNRAYVVGYSDQLRSPVWVAYRVGGGKRQARVAPRPDRFEVDRRVASPVTPQDYSKSGFDRGHLAPNHAIGLWFGEEAQRETFLMSNIVPQRSALNSGAWRAFESRLAINYPARFEEVWVLCGPVFSRTPERLTKGGVAIPREFFLIVTDRTDGRLRAQTFLIPQTLQSSDEWVHHRYSIDEVELRAGLDLFPDLIDEVETPFETSVASRIW